MLPKWQWDFTAYDTTSITVWCCGVATICCSYCNIWMTPPDQHFSRTLLIWQAQIKRSLHCRKVAVPLLDVFRLLFYSSHSRTFLGSLGLMMWLKSSLWSEMNRITKPEIGLRHRTMWHWECTTERPNMCPGFEHPLINNKYWCLHICIVATERRGSFGFRTLCSQC